MVNHPQAGEEHISEDRQCLPTGDEHKVERVTYGWIFFIEMGGKIALGF